MKYKDDWDEAVARMQAFWRGEVIDRCCVAVTAPRDTPLPCEYERRPAASLEELWLDTEYRYGQTMHRFATTYYGGESFPLEMCNLGPGVIAACMGGSFHLGEHTVWFDTEPFISDWDPQPTFRLDRESPMWRLLTGMTSHFIEHADGEYIVGLSDIGGNLDLIAACRGTERLLYDVYDHPDRIARATEDVDEVWKTVFAELQSIIDRGQRGCSSWMPIFNEHRWYPLQCDFSAMISPGDFETLVAPGLVREAAFLDNAIFHLDGPDAAVHIDRLLEIDEIDGIQWTPGAQLTGSPENDGSGAYLLAAERWFPLYEKIQKRGKRLVLLGARAQDVETLLQRLEPEGLFISTSCRSEEEADAILEQAEQATRTR